MKWEKICNHAGIETHTLIHSYTPHYGIVWMHRDCSYNWAAYNELYHMVNGNCDTLEDAKHATEQAIINGITKKILSLREILHKMTR